MATMVDNLCTDLNQLHPWRGRRPVFNIFRQSEGQDLMPWMAPATGIAMCQLAVSIDNLPMSGCGYKQTHPLSPTSSAVA
jgi:hypothetical protein